MGVNVTAHQRVRCAQAFAFVHRHFCGNLLQPHSPGGSSNSAFASKERSEDAGAYGDICRSTEAKYGVWWNDPSLNNYIVRSASRGSGPEVEPHTDVTTIVIADVFDPTPQKRNRNSLSKTAAVLQNKQTKRPLMLRRDQPKKHGMLAISSFLIMKNTIRRWLKILLANQPFENQFSITHLWHLCLV